MYKKDSLLDMMLKVPEKDDLRMRFIILLVVILLLFMPKAIAYDRATIKASFLLVPNLEKTEDLNLRGRELSGFAKDLVCLSQFDCTPEQPVGLTAVFKVTSTGSPKLNPEMKGKFVEIEYIDIPKNSELTPSDCNRLWGNNISQSPFYQTYKLLRIISKKEAESGVEREYFIDAIFENGKLSKYRIRGPEIKSTDWQFA